MKNLKTRVLSLGAAAIMAFSAIPMTTIQASAYTKPGTHYYYCRTHKNKSSDMYVRLKASFNNRTKKCTDVWWDSAYAHWPNKIEKKNTAKTNTYARGTYRIYGGLITQWVSLELVSKTGTIYIYR